ncbi:MAG TPA: hypothetical protein VG710_14090 [Opitutus sp.]|nr:hypothetical protein [Opitutus sp.]
MVSIVSAAAVISALVGVFLRYSGSRKLDRDYLVSPIGTPIRAKKPRADFGVPIKQVETAVSNHGSDERLSNAKRQTKDKRAELKELLARLPDESIPEMRFLTEDDWYAASAGPLDTEDDIRAAFSKLRAAAITRFAKALIPGVAAYERANPGKIPAGGIQDLLPYANGILDQSLMQRYRIANQSDYPNMGVGNRWVIVQVSAVDSKFDIPIVIGPHGWVRYIPGPMSAVK